MKGQVTWHGTGRTGRAGTGRAGMGQAGMGWTGTGWAAMGWVAMGRADTASTIECASSIDMGLEPQLVSSWKSLDHEKRF
jgi:hypothetical protein